MRTGAIGKFGQHLRSWIDNGAHPYTTLRSFDSGLPAQIVVDEENAGSTRRHRIVRSISADRVGEHDARQVIVRKSDASLLLARRESDLLGPDAVEYSTFRCGQYKTMIPDSQSCSLFKGPDTGKAKRAESEARSMPSVSRSPINSASAA